MSGIRLLGAGSAVPAQVVTNDDMARIVDTSDEWIVSRTGIRERRKCAGETQLQLVTEAAKKALAMAGIAPEELGAVLVATFTSETAVPSTAVLLQRDLGLREDTVCFDISAACSGFIYALHTAECLLAASRRKYGLVVGAEVLTRVTDYADRSTCILFGDGAGAAVVEWREDWPSICARLHARGDDRVIRLAGLNTGEPALVHMEGQAVFKFALEAVPAVIDEVLAAAGVSVDGVDCVVFHQANRRIIDGVLRRCGVPAEKCLVNVDRYGNTSAASVGLALDETIRSGMLKSGGKALCLGFGGGLTWGGCLLEMA